jgi:hypothetical protein
MTMNIELNEMTASELLHPLGRPDVAWEKAVDEAEAEALSQSCFLAGVPPIGWMKTWPELWTYSHYEQIRSIVLRGFIAMLKDGNLGAGYEAAVVCGRPIVMERLSLPNEDVKTRLLGLMDETQFGPPLEMTEERLGVVRSVLVEVLTVEDWGAIGRSAAAQVERQVIGLAA